MGYKKENSRYLDRMGIECGAVGSFYRIPPGIVKDELEAMAEEGLAKKSVREPTPDESLTGYQRVQVYSK